VRRLLARLGLAAALALVGPGAYAHAVTHVGEALAGHLQHHDDAGDGHQERYGCALDAAFAGADALGASAGISILPGAAASLQAFPRLGRTLPCEALARFVSRAPPVSR
jgi:hypothetical protein